MNIIYGSLIFLFGIILGTFYKKFTHKLAATIKNKQEDLNKKNDNNNISDSDEEEIDFEEEDLKMVKKKKIKT